LSLDRLGSRLERLMIPGAFLVTAVILGIEYPRLGAAIVGLALLHALWEIEPITRWHGGRSFRAGFGPVTSVAFTADGKQLVCGMASAVAVVTFDTASGAIWGVSATPAPSSESSARSPDGRLLAASAGARNVTLSDATTGARIRTLHGHSRKVNCLAFSPDGRLLASGSDDGSAKIWRV